MSSHSVCATHPPSTKGLRTPGTNACADRPPKEHSPRITTYKKEVNHTQGGRTQQILKSKYNIKSNSMYLCSIYTI